LTATTIFAPVANEVRKTNEGRHAEREAIHRDMAAVTRQHDADTLLGVLQGATIPCTRILDIPQVRDLPAVASRLTRSRLPDGRAIRMQPMAVDVAGARAELAFAPRYGEHTRALLAEAGLSAAEVQALCDAGVVA
jgi:crotonobetainyl-CoA:carnitine CoA-transferase CaiB-like acyl-CoA transferase